HLVRFLATRGDSESKSEYVFPSKRTGKPLNVKRVAKRFRRILKRAGLGPFKLYDLRHRIRGAEYWNATLLPAVLLLVSIICSGSRSIGGYRARLTERPFSAPPPPPP